MAELDPIRPALPPGRLPPDPDSRREGGRERAPPAPKKQDSGLTDDQADRRDDEPPLVDDYA
ncbi:hypothetical protein [Alkalilimnicola sp. S0819]|uniref:hypothetical protein n=1 Tax=Alkalilimnicola sp. S0819 TaxID=2613922 RepID=UPI0012622EB3|nr:hypothetical protein [Alkalilimnicola sp. S0819]KAB7627157.1 hypothetical protein F3N43_04385 [Alkalilimnicola sp. S0819]MPQ15866.1 hypothetical protein [Alkalilimnicola sp. S0819]